MALTHNRFFLPSLILACLALLTGASAAQQPGSEPAAWQDFNSFTLNLTQPGEPGYSEWRGHINSQSNDIQIDVETQHSGAVVRGKILMIGGRVMAIQGPIAEAGHEIDALDGPVLQVQLVTKLLARALPNGPASIPSAQHIHYADSKIGIEIATPSAGGEIPSPWRLVGDVKRIKPNGMEYSLTLTFRRPGEPGKETPETSMSFEGKFFNAADTGIDDRQNLEAWKVFDVGVQSRKQQGSTVYDYGATPATVPYRTVADVRKQLAADDYAGEPDPARDFTGFWKTDCANVFGLQIKHFGADGKYSIVFCGPGGCGDPADEGRKTFITKDPHFQVVSEDELKQQSADGWETYHRCSKDPQPALK